MSGIRAVFFDIDGVLVDSLEAHLTFCRDKSVAYRLGLEIPDAAGVRSLVQRGVPISPMQEFLRAVGFSKQDAERADAEYRRDFADHYPVRLFPSVPELLDTLRARGFALGFVTANARANVDRALGDCLARFDEPLRFYGDHPAPVRTKAEALSHALALLAIEPSQLVYVGDQPADELAARKAGAKFVEVTYGWGFSALPQRLATAGSVLQIAQALPAEKPTSADVPADLKLALEHGRALFTYHAGQRHATLNYYLVALNVFAVAVGAVTNTLIDKAHGLSIPLTLLAVFAAFLARTFAKLDKRNEQIVHMDEKLLKDVEGRIAQLTSLSQLRTIEACSEAPVHGGYSKLVPHLLLAYQGLFAAVALAAFVASCVYVGDTLAERERAQKIEEKRAQRRAEKEARAAAEKAEEKRRHEQQDHRSRRPRRPPVTPRAL